MKLNEKGKLALMILMISTIAIIGTIIYTKRVETIKNGTFVVVSDNEMDK